jgi:hypothetical protein
LGQEPQRALRIRVSRGIPRLRRVHLRGVRAKALDQTRDEYVLSARFDDTELPGLAPTIGYIELAEIAPESLVDLLAQKLGEPAGGA